MSEQLNSLHDALAKELARRIESGEATASDLGVAAKFLKDNGVTVDDFNVPGSPVGELKDSMSVTELPFPVQ